MPRDAHTRVPQPVFHEPNFGEETPTPDPTGFTTQHPSDTAVFDEVKDLLKKDVVGFEKSRGADDDLLQLEHAYGSHGAQVVQRIEHAGKIIFHAFGDSGASNARKYFNELRVADQVTMDCNRSDEANRPAFVFHLGDVVYNFGEAQYYYDQFYDPFRNYPAPIFAIPGNHDSFVVPGTPAAREPLKIFHRNFCADAPVITSEAGSLHRTAMTQPGFYFTLNAPFVRIIGLFSNALEDPGLISSQGGHWHGVPDFQLGFLTARSSGSSARTTRAQFCSRPTILHSAMLRHPTWAAAATIRAARRCFGKSTKYAIGKACIRMRFSRRTPTTTSVIRVSSSSRARSGTCPSSSAETAGTT